MYAQTIDKILGTSFMDDLLIFYYQINNFKFMFDAILDR